LVVARGPATLRLARSISRPQTASRSKEKALRRQVRAAEGSDLSGPVLNRVEMSPESHNNPALLCNELVWWRQCCLLGAHMPPWCVPVPDSACATLQGLFEIASSGSHGDCDLH